MNIAYLLDLRADAEPDGAALIRGSGEAVSWRALRQRVGALAGWFAGQGIAPGDRVALLAANSPAFAEATLAAAMAGVALVPLNWRLAAGEIADQLGDAEPKLLLVDDANAALAAAAGWRGAVLRLPTDGDGHGDGADYARALATAPRADIVPVMADHTLGIYYTGGTTGRAKGVMLSHGNMLANASQVAQLIPFRGGDVHLHAAPMFHLADLGYFFLQLQAGGTHAFLAQFRPEAFCAAVARWRVSTTLLAPTMLGMILAEGAHRRHDLSSWRQMQYGGSPVTEPVLRAALAELPCRLFQGYGQTEATHSICTMTHDDHVAAAASPGLLASCGRAAPGVMLRIVDADDRAVPPGETGEIIVRAPTVMTGYWRRPAETAAALRGGWLRTGDVARRDEAGRVFILDRKKDMIVTGAENVFSAEVENAIARHPAVAECAVIAVPDVRFGERVHAAIVLKPGAAADEAAIVAHCRALIAGYKVPRSCEFLPALPKNAFGKVQKPALRAPHWQGRERGVG